MYIPVSIEIEIVAKDGTIEHVQRMVSDMAVSGYIRDVEQAQEQERLEGWHSFCRYLQTFESTEEYDRAREFLLSQLDEQQRVDYEHCHAFRVKSQSGRLFRIHESPSMNIQLFHKRDFDFVVAEFCIAPVIDVPLPDQLLMQKLMLEYQETKFLEIANHHWLAPPSMIW